MVAQVETLGHSRVRLPAKYFDVVSEAGMAEYVQLAPNKSTKATINSNNLRSWMHESRQIAQRGAAIYPMYPTGGSMQDAFRRKVIANAIREGCDATSEEVEDLH